MNEFTKEELQELMHCVYAYRDLCEEDIEYDLCDKLKSMIDNYCEHKNHIGIHEWKTCNDCGRPFND
jgi:hypothetical protein